MAETQSLLRVADVSKSFPGNGNRLAVLDHVSFELNQGEFVALVGPSGCGKTTLLRILAGIEAPDTGAVAWNGSTGHGENDLSFAFQHLALLPWRTVEANIAFPLEGKKADAETAAKVTHLIDAFGLAGFERYYPAQLSGGMRQRVALARALITSPRLLILDEPFGALDVRARLKLQDLLLISCSAANVGVIIVSHDLHEAVRMSARILVLSARPARIAAEVKVTPWSPAQRLTIGAEETAPFVEKLHALL